MSGVLGDKNSLEAETRNALIITANGPAIKLVGVAERVEAVATKAPLGESPGTQPEGTKHGAFFASPGTSFLSFTSVAVQILLQVGNKSRYTKFYRKQVRGPDLSCITKLSKYLNTNAKNVTNLLTLALSVLGVRSTFLSFKESCHALLEC